MLKADVLATSNLYSLSLPENYISDGQILHATNLNGHVFVFLVPTVHNRIALTQRACKCLGVVRDSITDSAHNPHAVRSRVAGNLITINVINSHVRPPYSFSHAVISSSLIAFLYTRNCDNVPSK